MMRSAIVFGATGLIGEKIVRWLVASGRCSRVTTVVRRASGYPDPKVHVVVADGDSLESVKDQLAADDLYLAIGTTRAKVPDPKAYHRIDHDLPVRAAQLAREMGATRAAVVTSVGADVSSRSAYLRTKGELERDLAAVGFERLCVFRPSMLLGERDEKRRMERVLMEVFRSIEPLLIGPMDRFRGVQADVVAGAMVKAMGDDAGRGISVYQWREIMRLHGRGIGER